ncbi:MAG: acyl-CoA dehydrogenase family protein [Deltaproteobacteria bacterium]|nr:acyl-CoA dehydrogenase family protein [Deltaproteobacteria bacterium]MBW2421568.1 acyl-CoA dehydrogenase family protein [Deltaproteobacteria bacterium]
MDLSYGPEYDEFRAEVEAFVGQAWSSEDAADPTPERRRRFIEAATGRGYLYRNIPSAYGGSEQPFDPLREQIIAEVFAAAGAQTQLAPQGVGMIVPTLLEMGSEWQRERFIKPTLLGDYVWCQGYSETEAGSDLASLRSTARLEGDEWVIDGHKIWTSDADRADYMFGLFRSEPDESRHAGISYLLLDMKQPGIEVRPLRQITGATHFHEVFFDGVRTPADWIVGERGQGWQVTRVNLKHERNLGGGNMWRRRFEALMERARRSTLNGRPALEDSALRQRLAEIEGYVRCAETLTLRRLSAAARGEEAGESLGMLVNKLYGTQLGEMIAQTDYDLIGSDGLLEPTDASWGHVGTGLPSDQVDQYLFELCARIAAGTSNIQRNVIGERGLGLPRDLRRTR